MVFKLSKAIARGSKQEAPTSAQAIPHLTDSAAHFGRKGLLNGTAVGPAGHPAEREDITPRKTQGYQQFERDRGLIQGEKRQLGQFQQKETRRKAKLLNFLGSKLHHLGVLLGMKLE
ncbi:MAG: hypothetical protein Q9224_005287, partial [Gallowayella concinna]